MLQISVVETDWFFDLFEFRETKSFNTETNPEGEETSKYEDVGIESSNFFLLLGAVLLVIPVFGIIYLMKKLYYKILGKCGNNCLTRRKREEIPVMVVTLRFLLEGCLEIGLSAMICVLGVSYNFFQITSY